MNKEAKQNLWCFGIFLFAVLILSMYFVCAIVDIASVLFGNQTQTVNYTEVFGIVDEDRGYIYNLSINNSGGAGGLNITEINISLWGDFTYNQESVAGLTTGSNGTGNLSADLRANDPHIAFYFTNNTDELSFNSDNDTSYIIPGNISTNSSYFWFNLTVPEPGMYNMTVKIMSDNSSYDDATTYNEINISVHVKDVTIPENTNFSNTNTATRLITRGNYSGTILLNASISDNTGVQYVFFNLTNTSIDQNHTIVIARNGSDSELWWNGSLDTTTLPDGIHGLTIWANDSENNMNSTHTINITIDNTSPSVTLTSANNSRDSITVTIAAVDATTGISGTCSVDRNNAAVTGTGASQVLREDNLVCGQSYLYVVTCTDYTSHSRASSSTAFSTDACSGGGTSGGGSGVTSTFTWTNTYVTTDTQFEQGYTKELGANNRVKVKVGNNYHHVGVKAVTETSATIEIASDPVEVKLDVGEDAKVDVTGDGYYDVYVKLNAITNDKADVTIQKIYEEIPEGEGALATTGEDVTPAEEDTTTPAEERSLTWLWVIIGILVLAAVIGGGVAAKKRQ